jgi:ATP-dependent DNA ligase
MVTMDADPLADRDIFDLPTDIEPMEARLAEALPEGDWQYEPKWDGFRCLAFRQGDHVDIRAKSGKPLGRFFPEVLAFLQQLPADRFVLDGELVIELNGHLSFPALQARLHPAPSRIAKLSRETPARLVLFDILVTAEGQHLLDLPLRERRLHLEAFFAANHSAGQLVMSPATHVIDQARAWLSSSGDEATDGVVAKGLKDIYTPGERTMIKVKRLRTADCVVGGFRYQSESDKVGSLLLGLYNDDGTLDHVGFTATISNAERAALTKQLEALRQPPGFTGRAPGGPSRWSTDRSAEWQPLRPELVVEVRFDHVTDGRFRHGTKLLRWRPDKRPSQCTMEQIAPPVRLPDVVAEK